MPVGRRQRRHSRSAGADFRLPRQRERPLQDVRQDLSPFRGAHTASAERYLRAGGEASALQAMTHRVGNSLADSADDVSRLRFQTHPGKLTPGGGIDERRSLSSRSEERQNDEPSSSWHRRGKERIDVLTARAGQRQYPLQRRCANHCWHHSHPAIPLRHAEQHPGQRPIGLDPIDQHRAAERRAEDHQPVTGTLYPGADHRRTEIERTRMDRSTHRQSRERRPRLRELAQRGGEGVDRSEETSPLRDIVEQSAILRRRLVSGDRRKVTRRPTHQSRGRRSGAAQSRPCNNRRSPPPAMRPAPPVAGTREAEPRRPETSMFPERRNARSATPEAIHSVTIGAARASDQRMGGRT